MMHLFNESQSEKNRAHLFLKILNESRKRDKMQGLLSNLSLFRNVLNKFKYSGVQMYM